MLMTRSFTNKYYYNFQSQPPVTPEEMKNGPYELTDTIISPTITPISEVYLKDLCPIDILIYDAKQIPCIAFGDKTTAEDERFSDPKQQNSTLQCEIPITLYLDDTDGRTKARLSFPNDVNPARFGAASQLYSNIMTWRQFFSWSYKYGQPDSSLSTPDFTNNELLPPYDIYIFCETGNFLFHDKTFTNSSDTYFSKGLNVHWRTAYGDNLDTACYSYKLFIGQGDSNGFIMPKRYFNIIWNKYSTLGPVDLTQLHDHSLVAFFTKVPYVISGATKDYRWFFNNIGRMNSQMAYLCSKINFILSNDGVNAATTQSATGTYNLITLGWIAVFFTGQTQWSQNPDRLGAYANQTLYYPYIKLYPPGADPSTDPGYDVEKMWFSIDVDESSNNPHRSNFGFIYIETNGAGTYYRQFQNTTPRTMKLSQCIDLAGLPLLQPKFSVVPQDIDGVPDEMEIVTQSGRYNNYYINELYPPNVTIFSKPINPRQWTAASNFTLSTSYYDSLASLNVAKMVLISSKPEDKTYIPISYNKLTGATTSNALTGKICYIKVIDAGDTTYIGKRIPLLLPFDQGLITTPLNRFCAQVRELFIV